MNISELSWKEIEALPKDIMFFISIGPMEAHGPHLPVSTDLKIAQKIEERTISLLEKENISCISLPSLPIGTCKYLEGFPGTISLKWKNVNETQIRYRLLQACVLVITRDRFSLL